ncbi:MAG: M23 family metallopeptidase [Verrucomicrobiia bacterium]
MKSRPVPPRWVHALWLLALGGALGGVWFVLDRPPEAETEPVMVGWRDFFHDHLRPALPVTDGFDLPLRPPSGEGARRASDFRQGNLLGEWWETTRGTGTGAEPVLSAAHGWVTLAEDFGRPWGNVVIVAHRLPDSDPAGSVEILYANLSSLAVQRGHFVRRGQLLGAIDQDPRGRARLYLEVRDEIGMGLGPTESDDPLGWLEPSLFFSQRPAAEPALPLPPDH